MWFVQIRFSRNNAHSFVWNFWFLNSHFSIPLGFTNFGHALMWNSKNYPTPTVQTDLRDWIERPRGDQFTIGDNLFRLKKHPDYLIIYATWLCHLSNKNKQYWIAGVQPLLVHFSEKTFWAFLCIQNCHGSLWLRKLLWSKKSTPADKIEKYLTEILNQDRYTCKMRF